MGGLNRDGGITPSHPFRKPKDSEVQIMFHYMDKRRNHEIADAPWRKLDFVPNNMLRDLDHWHDAETFPFYDPDLDARDIADVPHGHWIAHKHGRYQEHAHYVLCTEDHESEGAK
jgi:hypothetical protein